MEDVKAAVLLNLEALKKYYTAMYNELYMNKATYFDIHIEKVYSILENKYTFKLFAFVAVQKEAGYNLKTLSTYCILTGGTEDEAIKEIHNIASSAGNESE